MAPLPGRGGPLPPVQPPQRLRLRLCEVRGAGKVPFPLALPGRGAAWPRQDDVLLLEILGVITDESGCPPAPAEKPRRGMTCCFRGQAILAGAGHLGLTDEGRLGRLPWGAHRPGCPPRRLAHPAASGSGRRFSWVIRNNWKKRRAAEALPPQEERPFFFRDEKFLFGVLHGSVPKRAGKLAGVRGALLHGNVARRPFRNPLGPLRRKGAFLAFRRAALLGIPTVSK